MHNVALTCTCELLRNKINANERGAASVSLASIHCVFRRASEIGPMLIWLVFIILLDWTRIWFTLKHLQESARWSE